MPSNEIVYTSYYGDLDGGGELRMLEHITRSSIPCSRFAVIVFKDGGLRKKLDELGVRVSVVPWSWSSGRLKRCFQFPYTMSRLGLRFLTRRPGLIVCNTFLDLRLVMPIATILRVPFVWRSRAELAFRLEGKNKKGLRLFVRLLGRYASRVLTTTEYDRSALIRHGIPEEKVTTVPNGVELQAFENAGNAGRSVRREFGIADETPVIGFVARLTPLKGHGFFLEALNRIRSEFTDFRALIVGDTAEQPEFRDYLTNRTRELDLDRFVQFAGHREDIPAIMNAIDLLVVASTQETFGTTVIEAMAAGKPVIATETPGPKEIIEPGETGLLVPPRDSAALAEALMRLLADPQRTREMGSNGRRRAGRNYRLAETLKSLDRHYLDAMSGRSGRESSASA